MLQFILEALRLRVVSVRSGLITTPKNAKARGAGVIPPKIVAIELVVRDVFKSYRLICDPVTFTKFAYKIVDIDTTKPYKVEPPFGKGDVTLPVWCLKEVQKASFQFGKVVIDAWKKYESHREETVQQLRTAGCPDDVIDKLLPKENPWGDDVGHNSTVH